MGFFYSIKLVIAIFEHQLTLTKQIVRDMKLLQGKTAIITGASRGIGKGIAQVFAEQGANVAFTYSSSVESAKALEDELNALGVKAKGYQSNAADYNEAQQLADAVVEEFGSIDILGFKESFISNSLGLFNKSGMFKDKAFGFSGFNFKSGGVLLSIFNGCVLETPS